MRNVLLVSLIFLILLIPSVFAEKNVVYVTSKTSPTSCNDLSLQDRLFCNRLESTLGFNVDLIYEGDVRDNSDDWNNVVSDADMIFLGDVSTSMINTSVDRNNFCSNINSELSGKKLFVVFDNSYYDSTRFLSGCAFGTPVGFGVSASDNNTCTATSIDDDYSKTSNEDFINEDWTDGTDRFYNQSGTVYVVGGQDSGTGWFEFHCTDAYGGTGDVGDYVIVNTTDAGAYWGLSDSNKFTTEAWEVFDRTVWYILNMTGWTIEPVYVYPKAASLNKDITVITKVSSLGEYLGCTGNKIEYQTEIASGNLTCNSADKTWSVKNIKFNTTGNKNIILKAYSNGDSTPKVERSIIVPVGSVNITINSGDYVPGSSYVINVTPTTSPPNSGSLNYVIWDDITKNVSISSGNFEEDCVICNATTNISKDYGELLLEINYNDGTNVGGNLKAINPQTTNATVNITTNKEEYRAAESLNIIVKTSSSFENVTLSIIGPDNILYPTNMSGGPTTWTFGPHSIPNQPINGIYTVKAIAITSTAQVISTKTIGIYSWKVTPDTDSDSYDPGDDVDISVDVTDYINTTFAVSAIVKDPAGTTIFYDNDSFRGNETLETTYTLSDNATGGLYEVKISVNDTNKTSQKYSETIYFGVGVTGDVKITPSYWSVVSNTAKTEMKTFSIQNIGNETIDRINITKTGDLASDITLDKTTLTSIAPNQTKTFSASLDASLPGQNTGGISLKGENISFIIQVSTSIGALSNVSYLTVLPSSISQASIPGEPISATFNIMNTGNETVTGISVNKTSVSSFANLSTVPTTLNKNSSANVTVTFNGTAVGDYSGRLYITSFSGDAQVSLSFTVLDDLNVISDDLLITLADLQINITELSNKGKDTTSIQSMIADAESLINESIEAYNAADYNLANQKFNEAKAKIASIESAISNMYVEQTPSDGAGIIWIFAFIIILGIIGFFAFKNKDKIKEYIDQMTGKKKEEKPQEQYPQEQPRGDEYEYPSGQDEYRTEYY